ncbi:MAG: type II/IV secretion system protein, partial [Sinobacterium sp.]|nr:type II/IV secretion system protein [Sinobacterium sp.]
MNHLAVERNLDLRSLLMDLQREAVLSPDDVDAILARPRSIEDGRKHPVNYIGELRVTNQKTGKILDVESLVGWVASQAGQDYFNIDPLKIRATDVTQVMSFAFAQKHKILAVEVTANEIKVASCQPFLSAWVENLSHVSNKTITRVFANPADVEKFTTEFYTLAKSISDASSDDLTNHSNLEAFLELGALTNPDANDQHIVTIVDWLFQYAFDQRASDIHIEPRREVGFVRFRIDGVLHQVYEMPMQALIAVISRIKSMGRLDIAEKRKPQDGRLKTKTPEGLEVELRLSTLPTAFGEKMVMRIFDPEVLLKSFDQLGLANQDYSRWAAMTKKPNGIVLVTGPTGSGKTTTLYSTLKELATAKVNVCSIEDPIEMVEDSFNQMQVNPAIGLDFATGIKALLRQDPDIIMIGEIRNKETAEMAVQAALTGHLVLSTLHTNDAPSSVTRLLEVGVPSYLIRATVLGVMAQRLVRRLCPNCKEECSVDENQWKALVAPWTVPVPPYVHKGVGCLECRNTGYLGREGIYEVMPMSPNVQRHIKP